MSKSILVIDTPSACIDCPCHFADDTVWCGVKKKGLLADDIETFKPDWCPLKEVPLKLVEDDRWFTKDFAQGYIACVDKILKERDGNEID